MPFLCRFAWFSTSMLACLLAVASSSAQSGYSRFVDPMLGVAGGGNVFPGPVVPFGMIKPGPDMTFGARDYNAGWNDQGTIRGFSQTHVSGTGGGAKYGNILIQPTTGPIAPFDAASDRSDERAAAGLYGVALTRWGVDVQITATRRSALYRFTYPAGQPANLLVNVAAFLRSGYRTGETQQLVGSKVQVLSPTELAGSTTIQGGWNKQTTPYTVYFYAVTDTPAATSGVWLGFDRKPGIRETAGGANQPAGAWLTFPGSQPRTVRMKLAISFISVEQARQSLAAEVPAFDFDATRAATLALWDKALSRIEIEASQDQKKIFYTALYHTMLMPVDRTGENPLWQSSEPSYDDFYAIWDTFRSSSPLLTLMDPDRQAAIVRSLVDIYRHDGYLPDARSGNFNGRTQGGSNAEFLLTDAYLKGLKGIDWNAALTAEIHDAEVPPADHFKEGRGGLDDWKRLGYVSLEGSDRPASVHMEYAANDYEIALLAKGLGRTEDYKKYLARSGNWRNLWDKDFTDGGFSGFIRSRHRDGSWLTPFTALDFCTWNGPTFYEGNSWTYSLFVPQDVAGLIQQTGGAETFIRRLDAFFDVPFRYDVGNEPGFLAPYLYIWAGRPDKTAERIHQIIAKSYHAGPTGLPGNDDSGAMSSWYAFGQMGFFPNAGQGVYLIGSPAYARTTLHLVGGKAFTIEARNLSDKAIYVVAATLNGKPLDRAWLRHQEIVSGGHLVLTMAAQSAHWAEKNPPPSSSTNN
ncbi:MAG: GH92 family glycosyl hydrolase [Terracidiphilus sp.]|nr:GH92 family glycosyl hydrolase [Terracidiphilus sp.]